MPDHFYIRSSAARGGERYASFATLEAACKAAKHGETVQTCKHDYIVLMVSNRLQGLPRLDHAQGNLNRLIAKLERDNAPRAVWDDIVAASESAPS